MRRAYNVFACWPIGVFLFIVAAGLLKLAEWAWPR